MARKPEQSAEAIHEDRKRLVLVFERAEANTSRTKSRTRTILLHLAELIEIYHRESIELRSNSTGPGLRKRAMSKALAAKKTRAKKARAKKTRAKHVSHTSLNGRA